jgi:hypothetical protein
MSGMLSIVCVDWQILCVVDWQVQSDEVTELPVEPEPILRSCVSTASMKVKNMKK